MSEIGLTAETATAERPEHAPESASAGLYPPKRSGRSTRMIGEVVVDLGFADRETVDAAVETARAQGRPTGLVLVEEGVLRHDQLARVVAERFGLDYVDLAVFDLDMGAVNLLNPESCKRYQAVPIGFTDDDTVLLAMADPTNVLTIDDVAMMTGRRVKPVAASVEDLNLLLARLSSMEDSIEDIVEEDVEAEEEQDLLVDEADRDAPIIKLVHSIVAQAIQQGASDIHINPEEGDTRVLFRVDGVLAPAATVKRKMAMGVVSRIKIMADLDISEKRMPQDGLNDICRTLLIEIRNRQLAAGSHDDIDQEDGRQGLNLRFGSICISDQNANVAIFFLNYRQRLGGIVMKRRFDFFVSFR